MELKTKYQYTYFIYPYVIKNNKYIKYIMKLLKNKNVNLKIFQKDKDWDIYQYFLPKVRDYMFSSFGFSKAKIKTLEQMSIDTKAAVLAKYPCTMFEYNIKDDIQGKAGYKDGIFFKIQKIDLICFNTGICFLCMKTNIEETEEFANILNFNYKFRDINQEYNNLNNYDNIRVQTDTFTNMQEITNFIKEITGPNIDASKLDLETERFLTYSYACIDQEAWNNTTDFNNIKDNFIKYAKILPNDNSVDYSKENMKIVSEWKYAKLGITKTGVCLFSSTFDMNNYTILPQQYEMQYLYTYLFILYKKIYLKKISLDFSSTSDMIKVKKEFVDFTKKIWIQEVTEDDIGTAIYHSIKEVLEIDELYYKSKNKYDILYKELNVEKNSKINKVILLLLAVSLLFNIGNFIALILS